MTPERTIKRAIVFVLPGAALLVAMTLFMWRFALFSHRALIHGDSIGFGLPLFELRGWVIQGTASGLWTDLLFGGHPIFAEGQAAFVSPLPMLLSALVIPIGGAVYAENLFPVFYVTLTGIGMIGLARTLGLSPWASAFAALAVAFSPLWLDLQSNAGVSGTFLWVPWSLWAMEVWLKRPSLRSAAVMALALANMIVAGYTQTIHGTVIYMAVTLITVPFSTQMRRSWSDTWRRWLVTGAISAILCIGLAAVQILPLAELVGLSHRSGGIPLSFEFGAKYFARGMLFTLRADPNRLLSFPNIGCLLVCILASGMLLFQRSSRLIGHLAAALVLLQLGMGTGSPFFRFVYNNHLIPGLHFLRGVSLYTAIGAVGIGIAAGAAIDGIARWAGALRAENRSFFRQPVTVGLVVLAVLWGWGIERLHTSGAPLLQFGIVLGAVAAVALLARIGRASMIPMAIAILLVIECAGLRIQPFHLASASMITKPDSVKAIQALPDWQDFKLIDESIAPVYSFQDSRSVAVIPGLHRLLSAVSSSTGMLWGIHSMDGSLALPLGRRMMIKPLIEDEIAGRVATPPGLRLIDILGIRFVSADGAFSTVGFSPFWHGDDGIWIMENSAAQPRFQAYASHVSVDTPEAALDMIASWKKPTLVIENPPGPNHRDEMPDVVSDNDGPPLTFRVEHAEATAYRFDVSAARPGWLFLSDANYPGWTAMLDGRAVPLFTAQILGKAVAIPPGQHTVSIEFHSGSFRWGLLISLLTLGLTMIALLFGPKLASLPAENGRNRL